MEKCACTCSRLVYVDTWEWAFSLAGLLQAWFVVRFLYQPHSGPTL